MHAVGDQLLPAALHLVARQAEAGIPVETRADGSAHPGIGAQGGLVPQPHRRAADVVGVERAPVFELADVHVVRAARVVQVHAGAVRGLAARALHQHLAIALQRVAEAEVARHVGRGLVVLVGQGVAVIVVGVAAGIGPCGTGRAVHREVIAPQGAAGVLQRRGGRRRIDIAGVQQAAILAQPVIIVVAGVHQRGIQPEGRAAGSGVARGVHAGADDVAALPGEDRLAVELLERVGDAATAPCLAAAELELGGIAAATGGGAAAHAQVITLPVVTGDDVDHAGHRIGAVDRRRTAVEHLDAFHHHRRNAADADAGGGRAGTGRVLGHALAVEQDQLIAHAQSAQVEERGIRLRGAGVELATDDITVELGQRLQRFGHGAVALLADVLTGDHHHRRRAFDRGALDARTGDLDLVQRTRGIAAIGRVAGRCRRRLLRLCGTCGRCHGRQRQGHEDRH